MKKIYAILIGGLLTFTAGAQSQRLVLIEEFTQASCGPCAAANPTFNTLLNNNAGKCVSLKYQTNWPGVDPMNAQYPSGVSSRVSYYSCTSVPYAIMDGVAVTGSSYTGYPGNLNSTKINNEYNVASPFTIYVSHYLSNDQDSIFITANIECTQAFTAVSYLRGHLALVEKHIDFNSPPGSNGETDFYMVCRRFLPNQAGTSLPMTWAVGDDSTITVKAAIPSYIYDINQLAVVCFVQDNGTKQVMQAGYSISPVGVHDYAQSPANISLFPNPANNVVKMNFDLEQSNEVFINIYTITGELVLTQKRGTFGIGNQTIEINLEMLANGMYTVELLAGEQRMASKLNVVH
jgi:hypothetical protein